MRTLFCAALAAGFLIPHTAWARAPGPDCNPDKALAAVHIPADQPDLMAIGDSIYNGVESLSLVQAKTNFSPPNLVAGKLSLTHPFRIPQYGTIPLLIDLDVTLRQSWASILLKTGPQTVASISAYADPKNPQHPPKQPFFDDIAVAQADSTGLICDTAADGNWFVHKYYNANSATPVKTVDLGIPDNIESWLYALNSSYILNPTGNHAFDRLSQLDEVLLRKPKMLLVNIGSNDGVWLMAFNAYMPDTCYSPGNPDSAIVPCSQPHTTIAIELKDLEANMRFIAAKLKHFTPDTKVIVNLLPRPSAAANISPPLNSPQIPPASQPYFPTYENYVGTGGIHDVSGKDAAAMDSAVAAANAQIEKDVCAILTPQRVAFMDLYKLLTKYDYKNNPKAPQIQVNLRLDNGMTPVAANNRILNVGDDYIAQGGLFGYDNMHPTVLGYTLVANAVLGTIRKFNAVSPHATDCVQGIDDAATIDPQSVADKVNGTSLKSRIPTALTIDISAYRFLGAVHDLLKYETAQAGTAGAALYQATLHMMMLKMQGTSSAQAASTGTMMHALFRMGHYPSGNRMLHAAASHP